MYVYIAATNVLAALATRLAPLPRIVPKIETIECTVKKCFVYGYTYIYIYM